MSQKGSRRWAAKGPHQGVARAPLAARHRVVWWPWPTTDAPLSHTSSSRRPKTEGRHREVFRRHHEAETTEREKLSGREKSTGGIPSRRGKIVAIVIVIELGFIGIIIIISTTEHHHPHHATPFRCNILGRILSSS